LTEQADEPELDASQIHGPLICRRWLVLPFANMFFEKNERTDRQLNDVSAGLDVRSRCP
jgi:hypothetical protein